MRFLLRTFSIQ